MSSPNLTLSQIVYGKTYKVIGSAGANSNYHNHLESLGFTKGTLVQKGPASISDPFSVFIRGSRIALRKKEATELLVEEVSEKQEVAHV